MNEFVKKLIVVVLGILFFSCTSLQVNNNFDSKLYQTYYDNWELEKLKEEISKLKKTNSNKARIYEKYLLERLEDKISLKVFLEELVFNLKENNTNEVTDFIKEGFINNQIIKSINSIDFSNATILYGDANFHKNRAENIIGIIIREEVFYFRLNYQLLNREWRIITIKNGVE